MMAVSVAAKNARGLLLRRGCTLRGGASGAACIRFRRGYSFGSTLRAGASSGAGDIGYFVCLQRVFFVFCLASSVNRTVLAILIGCSIVSIHVGLGSAVSLTFVRISMRSWSFSVSVWVKEVARFPAAGFCSAAWTSWRAALRRSLGCAMGIAMACGYHDSVLTMRSPCVLSRYTLWHR